MSFFGFFTHSEIAQIPTPTIIVNGIPIINPNGNGKYIKHSINVRNAAAIPIMMNTILRSNDSSNDLQF